MNKKGVIAIVVIIVLAVIGYVIWGKSDSTQVNNSTDTQTNTEVPAGTTKDTYKPVTKDSTDTSLIGRLKNTSVAASEDGTRVALSNGIAKYTSGNVKGTITLGDVAVAATVGSTKYALATIAVNLGGSGTYKYVVLFQDNGNSLTDLSYTLMGDRVNITGLRADTVSGNNGKTDIVVTVSYLDHDAGEPLSANPTVPHTKILVAEDGVFNPSKEINF